MQVRVVPGDWRLSHEHVPLMEQGPPAGQHLRVMVCLFQPRHLGQSAGEEEGFRAKQHRCSHPNSCAVDKVKLDPLNKLYTVPIGRYTTQQLCDLVLIPVHNSFCGTLTNMISRQVFVRC